MAFDDISGLVLTLYRASGELSVDEFQEKALEIVKSVVPFDSSMWGTATYDPATGLDIHSIHLHEQSPEMLLAYEEFKHLDTSALAVTGKPFITKGFHCPTWFGDPEFRGYRAFQKQYGLGNVMITSRNDMNTGYSQWVSLFRRDADQQSRPVEIQHLAQLAPHVMNAYGLNLSRHLDRFRMAGDGGQVGMQDAAIADARGVIQHATPGWDATMQGEWGAGAAPGRLPEALLHACLASSEPYVGMTLAARHRIEKDLLFVRARPSCAADYLAPRQREVAQLTANGLTYKEVAKRLNLAPATVRTHLQHVYLRLEVQNVAGLVSAMRAAQW